MTEPGAECLRVALTQLSHFTCLCQGIFRVLPDRIMLADAIHLAQLILRAKLNPIECGRHLLIVQLRGGLQGRLQARLQTHGHIVGNGHAPIG